MPRLSADERQMLDDSLKGYLSEHHPFERRWSSANDPAAARRRWADYAGFGWLGVALPASAGGTGAGFTELGIVMAAAGRHLVQDPLLGTIVLGAGCIDLAGTRAQREDLLPQIVDGRLRLAFCHTEPDAGFAREFVETLARPAADGFTISGSKGFTLGAHAADRLIVSARIGSGEGPVALFLLERTALGVTLDPAPALDGRPGAGVHLSSVVVPAEALLGEPGQDRLALIDQVLDRGAIAVGAAASGARAAATAAPAEAVKRAPAAPWRQRQRRRSTT